MKPLSIFDHSCAPTRTERAKTWWLEGCPGLWSTLVVLACFAAGMIGLWLIWTMGEAVNTAIRG